MKSFLKVATGVFALSMAQQASADVTIRLTGSTAFRSAVHKSIIASMGGDASTKIAHSGGSQTQGSLDGANFATFSGAVSGISGTTFVQCSWSGSAAGVGSVATGATNLNYIATSALPGSNGVANANATATATAGGAPAAHFAMSDVFQANTPTPTPSLTNANVAIVPFVWVANEGSTITGVTSQQARAILGSGSQPRSLFTGDAAHTDLVYITGRDTGSGTRVSCLAETKYGITIPVNHWAGPITSGNTITKLRLWPATTNTDTEANTLGGRDALAGNGGYASGSSVRTLMGLTTGAVDTYDADNNLINSGEALTLIAWLGAADTTTAVSNGAVRLTYEGVLYDDVNGPAKIYNGQYTAWGYQHLYTSSGLSADETTFRTRIIAQMDVAANLGTAGLRQSLMTVGRQTDGAVVGP